MGELLGGVEGRVDGNEVRENATFEPPAGGLFGLI
jgi:hypothetical protein